MRQQVKVDFYRLIAKSMLEYDFGCKSLLKALVILYIDCFYQQIFRTFYEIFIARILLWYRLKWQRKANHLKTIVLMIWQVKFLASSLLNHLNVFDYSIVFWTVSPFDPQILIIFHLIWVAYYILSMLWCFSTSFDLYYRLFVLLTKIYFEIKMIPKFYYFNVWIRLVNGLRIQ